MARSVADEDRELIAFVKSRIPGMFYVNTEYEEMMERKVREIHNELRRNKLDTAAIFDKNNKDSIYNLGKWGFMSSPYYRDKMRDEEFMQNTYNMNKTARVKMYKELIKSCIPKEGTKSSILTEEDIKKFEQAYKDYPNI
nr:uncharacterized protein LOC117224728 [Megalopta genalis]